MRFHQSLSSRLYTVFLLISSFYTLSACSDDKPSGPWASFKPLNEIDKNIEGYYQASLGEAANSKSGNPAVYVDFSDGLIQAYTVNQNVQIVQTICNKLLDPNIEWYSLGTSTIKKLEYNSNELFNKVSDPSQYKDIMAPIQDALKKITASSNDALLITDFEEYTADGKEQFENYPKTYFSRSSFHGLLTPITSKGNLLSLAALMFRFTHLANVALAMPVFSFPP